MCANSLSLAHGLLDLPATQTTDSCVQRLFDDGLYAASFDLASFAHTTPLPLASFKSIVVVCTGLVFYGEGTLLAHERETRMRESRLRKEARIDLARRGIVGTESEIAKWKEEKLKAMDEERAKQSNEAQS